MAVRITPCWIAIVFLATSQFLDLHAAEPLRKEGDDPGFLVQGEYVGDVTKLDGKKMLGVQVIALGKGKFHAVWR
ncbi:MAG: hypothetical protein FD138_2594, partial [Planctomycetota bacterium]